MRIGAPRLRSIYRLGSDPHRIQFRRRSKHLVSLLVAAQILVGCEAKREAPHLAPPVVEVTEVVQRDVPIYSEWVAQLNGPNNAQITPRVQGYLLRQDYHDGFFVKRGQLLYEIDP